MESSNISFEKIPILKGKKVKDVETEGEHVVYNIKADGKVAKVGKLRTVSTNTGPDIVHMLDKLKSHVFNEELPPPVDVQNDKYNLKARRKRNIER